MYLFQIPKEAIDVLSIENITVLGIMSFVIFLLIYDRERAVKKHEIEKNRLFAAIKDAQEELRKEFKETNEDLKKITEKYHIFTIKIFEKLNSILHKK